MLSPSRSHRFLMHGPLHCRRTDKQPQLRYFIPWGLRTVRERATGAGDDDELARMSQVSDRLLLLGRIEARTAEAGVLDDVVDLVSVVAELDEQCTPFALESRVVLRREAPAHAYIRGNRILLVEAILKLIDNAIRHTPPGGTVRLAVQDNDRECSVSVVDNGPGVPDAEPDLIFRSFYQQIAESTALTPGGLGLAILRTVVQAHAGRIEVASASGQSTAFRLIFPARQPSL